MQNKEIKIETGVAIPDRVSAENRYLAAIKKLKVGQSFEFPSKDYNSVCIAKKKAKITNRKMELLSRSTRQSFRRIWRIQ